MKRMHKLILPLLATVLFITAGILELTDAGRYMDLLFSNLSVIKLFQFVLGLTVAGMLIATFTFRKRRYTERLGITIPLSFIAYTAYVFSLIIIYVYGLDEEYNYFTAKRDLKNGKIQLLYAGQLVDEGEKVINAIDSLKTVYGFSSLNVGVHSRGVERYNEAVESYLKARNGKNWHSEYMLKIDSVRNANEDLTEKLY